MDAGGAGHLGQALHRAFNVLARHHHEVGHFVDDDDDIGHGRHVHLLLLENGFARFGVEAGLHGARHFLALGQGLLQSRVVTIDVAHPEL